MPLNLPMNYLDIEQQSSSPQEQTQLMGGINLLWFSSHLIYTVPWTSLHLPASSSCISATTLPPVLNSFFKLFGAEVIYTPYFSPCFSLWLDAAVIKIFLK